MEFMQKYVKSTTPCALLDAMPGERELGGLWREKEARERSGEGAGTRARRCCLGLAWYNPV